MPKFSQKSISQLETCHPELQMLFNEVIKYFDCTVIEGHRGEAKQEEAFKAGNSKLHYPHGKHNKFPSMAVDVAPAPIDWKDVQRFTLFAGFVLGVAAQLYASGTMKFKVRWGGDWNRNTMVTDEKFRDMPHFELLGE